MIRVKGEEIKEGGGKPMDNGASSYHRFRENGDETGLVEIIRDYKDGLIFFLYGIVNDLYLAEELAEDTFVLLGTKKPRDNQKGSFKTWLYTIGRHVAIDYLRKPFRLKEIYLDEEIENSLEIESFENEYIRQEKKLIVHKALKKLKSDYRQVLWLLYFEELSCKECAFIMRKSVHGIETLSYRAKKALRKQLEQEGFKSYEDI